MVVVRAVREVHAHDVEASTAELRQLGNLLRLRSDRADDARFTQRSGLRVDVKLRVVLHRARRILRIGLQATLRAQSLADGRLLFLGRLGVKEREERRRCHVRLLGLAIEGDHLSHLDDAEVGQGRDAGGPRVCQRNVVALLDETSLLRNLHAVHEARRDVLAATLRLFVGIVVGDAAAVKVARCADVGIAADDEDGAARLVLGDESRRGASRRQRDDQGRLVVGRRVDARVGNRLVDVHRDLAGHVNVGSELLVIERRLGLLAHRVHHAHRLARVRALGRLT
mmetsp:Transcript_29496/g.76115  ORF Transcript_29496/g.76115 Transcript_29496/m.76115 type:complete len:283 (-) Transcript_29496:149-997(-)